MKGDRKAEGNRFEEKVGGHRWEESGRNYVARNKLEKSGREDVGRKGRRHRWKERVDENTSRWARQQVRE